MVIRFIVMVVPYLLFPHNLLYVQTYRINCTSAIMKRQCKAIPTFGFDTRHSREALLALPCDEECYGST